MNVAMSSRIHRIRSAVNLSIFIASLILITFA
jgi:hypothetical protein